MRRSLLPTLALSTILAVPGFAQFSAPTNQDLTKDQKTELKQQEKANKAQAKADKAKRKALDTDEQKKADKTQDKADKAQEKAAPLQYDPVRQ